MTINRSALRRNSAADLLAKVKQASEKKGGGNSGADSREWKPTVDAAGNGFAVLRFLPSKQEEDLPFVKLYNHGFQIGSKWFIEDCPTTIGKDCPVCDHNSELWNSGFDADKDTVRKRKRRLRYMSNVMVIKDPKNPENEGKMFLYGYGQKIFDKLTSAMNPPEEYGEEPRDPFGFFEGCVVKLKIKNKDGYRNYDDTVVEPASDLYDGDEDKLMAVLEALHDLNEFTAPAKYKEYSVLEDRFRTTIGEPKAAQYEPEPETPEPSSGTGTEASYSEPEPTTSPADPGAGDDDLEFFKNLMDE